MPEGDSLHRAARGLRALVGERLEVSAPHPRAQVKRIAERLDGRRLEAVEAVGKNLLLRFEGGVVLRSHLRLKGRWRVQPRGSGLLGQPWLVLRGSESEAVLWHGPVLELSSDVLRRLGPDILAEPPELDAMLARLRGADRRTPVGVALQSQRLVAGIGNMWMSETLWRVGISPWARLGDLRDDELRAALETASALMRDRLEGRRGRRRVYRRAGLPCPSCGTPIRSRGQGDANRIAYWCPSCQRGPRPPRRAEAGPGPAEPKPVG
jgi:endonuclease VIII